MLNDEIRFKDGDGDEFIAVARPKDDGSIYARFEWVSMGTTAVSLTPKQVDHFIAILQLAKAEALEVK